MTRHFVLLSGFLLMAFIAPVQGFETEPRPVVAKIETGNSNFSALNQKVEGLYSGLNLERKGLSNEVFRKALIGYLNLKAQGKLSDKPLLTVVDFEKSSREKRLWVIDIEKQKVLFNTLVAHGKNTGEEFARTFSNTNQSLMSSLGFYVTANTYFGKHGLSLRLRGMDENFNTNALQRAVVMHGANYVSEEFVKKHGRLGRSFGCPALPMNLHKDIIELVKDRTCLFVHYPEESYTSAYLNEELAMEALTTL